MKSGKITAEITLHVDPVVKNIIHAPLMDSVSWFKMFKFHLPGKVTIKFYSQAFPEILALEKVAQVISTGMSLCYQFLLPHLVSCSLFRSLFKEDDASVPPSDDIATLAPDVDTTTDVPQIEEEKSSVAVTTEQTVTEEKISEITSITTVVEAVTEAVIEVEVKAVSEIESKEEKEENIVMIPDKVSSPSRRQSRSKRQHILINEPIEPSSKEPIETPPSPIKENETNADIPPSPPNSPPKKRRLRSTRSSSPIENFLSLENSGGGGGDVAPAETIVLDEEEDDNNPSSHRKQRRLLSRNPQILHRPWIPCLYVLTPLNTVYTLPAALYGVLLDDQETWSEPPSPSLLSPSPLVKPPKQSVTELLRCRDLKPKNLNHSSKKRHDFKGGLLPPSY
jgi:hypothetical protein